MSAAPMPTPLTDAGTFEERCALGAAMRSSARIIGVTLADLPADAFSDPRLAMVRDAVVDLAAQSLSPDAGMVQAHLIREGQVEQRNAARSAALLLALFDGAPAPAMLAHYCAAVRQAWVRREAALIGERLTQAADGSLDALVSGLADALVAVDAALGQLAHRSEVAA